MGITVKYQFFRQGPNTRLSPEALRDGELFQF